MIERRRGSSPFGCCAGPLAYRPAAFSNGTAENRVRGPWIINACWRASVRFMPVGIVCWRACLPGTERESYSLAVMLRHDRRRCRPRRLCFLKVGPRMLRVIVPENRRASWPPSSTAQSTKSEPNGAPPRSIVQRPKRFPAVKLTRGLILR